MPANPLQLVSCKTTLRLVPLRTVGSRLTSSTASSMASCAARPIVESYVKRAPTATSLGLAPAADAVRAACTDWGAFYVVGHGVPGELLDAVREAGLAFFRAPMGDKLRFACDPARGAAAEGYGNRMLANDDSVLDWRDYFDHHTLPESRRDPAHWPDFVPGYR